MQDMKSKTVNSAGSVCLASFLKNRRVAQGLSRLKLGSRMDLSHTVIKDVEEHGRRLDLVELVRFCKALDLNPAEALKIVKDAESGTCDEVNEVSE